ncbi:MAG: sulfatase-like hydrolase/transferase [Verrucomicrobia bacterium]|nr:sulfatase-like hydrolase/transferase [Verrucomicrobiota bacterium]
MISTVPFPRLNLRPLAFRFFVGALILWPKLFCCPIEAAERPLNVILIVTDDMGYADMSCQGATDIHTPNLDRMAAEGTRFTNFYVAQAVCTASRASFMSGCYANRVGLQGALNHTSKNGIHPNEWLLPEMFKDRGYATSGMGKWHLGTVPEFGPLRNGFDEWLGIPYSNDNSKYHPVLAAEMPPLPFYDGKKVIELDPDQSGFTKRFTERAVSFIERNANTPFFLYMPHVMPHVPIFASENFRGRSKHGIYGDVIEELDWSVGEILGTLKRLGIDDRTLVIFFSDNGPWLSYGEHAGSATPLREGKLTTFEGGVRVPCIMRWPGNVPAHRVSDAPFMSIDLLPTLTALAGGKESRLKIDGLSVKPLLMGEPGAKSPHEALFFFAGSELHALRSGKWKLHFAHPYITTAGEPGKGGKPSNWGKSKSQSITQSGIDGIASRHGGRVEHLELSLFDLETDPGESKNVAAQHPDIVARLTRLAEPVRAELGDALTGVKGTSIRQSGVTRER